MMTKLGESGQAGTESEVEITPEALLAGAKALDQFFFCLDPEARPLDLGLYKLAAREVYRVMTLVKCAG